MKKVGFLMIALVLVCSVAGAANLHKESWYQERWCNEVGGETEYVLPDRARVDCLTDTLAVEFDFAHKWAEAIGQSLYYSAMTGRSPGIVLIMEKPGDYRYLLRLSNAINSHNIRIKVFAVEPQMSAKKTLDLLRLLGI